MSDPKNDSQPILSGQKLRFGAFEVDLQQRELRNRGIRIHLQRKPFLILELLLKKPGQTVTRTELEKYLWPDLHVSFGRGLNTAINTLRQALGDSSGACRYIETRSGFGYRFMASVEEVSEREPSTSMEAAGDSLLVLPFENATGDAAVAHLADNIAEELIAALATLQQIKVTSRSTAFRFRGAGINPRQIGAELGARRVLTGRIARHGTSIVVSTELIDTASDHCLWAEQYKCDADGLLDISRSIFATLGKRLATSFVTAGANGVKGHHSGNPEADRDYQKGKYLQRKMTEADLGKSIAQFESAIAQDHRHALAYVGLAETYSLFALQGLLPPAEARRRADELTQVALHMNEELAEAHVSFAHIKMLFDWDYPAAERAYVQALKLNPDHVDGRRSYAAFLSAMGRHEDAERQIELAQKLDSLSLQNNVEAARNYYLHRKFEDCIQQAWQALILEPQFAPAQHLLGLAYEQIAMYDDAITELQNARTCSGNHPSMAAALAHTYARAGMPENARELLHALEERSQQQYVSPYSLSIVYTGLGAHDLAVRALERAYSERDVSLVWLKAEPRFDPLRIDSRFSRLLKAVGFDTGASRAAFSPRSSLVQW